MTRPRGEIRQVLAATAARLAPPGTPLGQGVTWRELVRAACVGELMGRRTVVDMHRAGELEVVGTRRVPGVCRPLNLYALASRPPEGDAAALAALGAVLRAWALPQGGPSEGV